MSSPRFHPLLMPDTTRSGTRLRMIAQARLTQSVGVPSTPYTPSRDVLDAQRAAQRQRVADGARLLQRRDDNNIAEGPYGGGQRVNSVRRNPIVIGDQNERHESSILPH